MYSEPDSPTYHQQEIVDEFIALTPGEAAAHDLFSYLSRATHGELLKLGKHPIGLDYGCNSPCNSSALASIIAAGAKIPDELVQGWKDFAVLYQDLIARNPRLELRDLMQDISERRESASWPTMYEWDIERWIADGAPAGQMPYPIDADIRDRLLELYPLLGGWLYSVGHKPITFAETTEFREIKVRMDAERGEAIQQERERLAELKRQYELAVAGLEKQHGNAVVLLAADPNGQPVRIAGGTWIVSGIGQSNDEDGDV